MAKRQRKRLTVTILKSDRGYYGSFNYKDGGMYLHKFIQIDSISRFDMGAGRDFKTLRRLKTFCHQKLKKKHIKYLNFIKKFD